MIIATARGTALPLDMVPETAQATITQMTAPTTSASSGSATGENKPPAKEGENNTTIRNKDSLGPGQDTKNNPNPNNAKKFSQRHNEKSMQQAAALHEIEQLRRSIKKGGSTVDWSPVDISPWVFEKMLESDDPIWIGRQLTKLESRRDMEIQPIINVVGQNPRAVDSKVESGWKADYRWVYWRRDKTLCRWVSSRVSVGREISGSR